MDIHFSREVSFSFQSLLAEDKTSLQKYSSIEEAKQKDDVALFQLAQLTEELAKANTIYSFKDYLKRIRNHLKQNEKQAQNENVVNCLVFLTKLVTHESFLGDVRDIKGIINDFLIELLANPSVKPYVRY